jgi:hypothetical protein
MRSNGALLCCNCLLEPLGIGTHQRFVLDIKGFNNLR